MKTNNAACLVLKLRTPSGLSAPRLEAYLGARSDERDGSGAEYPIAPDAVNGLECSHGSLCIMGWMHDGASGPSVNAPEYDRLAYVDLHKVGMYQKTLAKLDRRFRKMREARGYVQSWTEQAMRFAEATGAKCFAIPAELVARIDRQRGRERPRDLRGERFLFCDAIQAREEIDALVASMAPASDIAPSLGAVAS